MHLDLDEAPLSNYNKTAGNSMPFANLNTNGIPSAKRNPKQAESRLNALSPARDSASDWHTGPCPMPLLLPVLV